MPDWTYYDEEGNLWHEDGHLLKSASKDKPAPKHPDQERYLDWEKSLAATHTTRTTWQGEETPQAVEDAGAMFAPFQKFEWPGLSIDLQIARTPAGDFYRYYVGNGQGFKYWLPRRAGPGSARSK